MNTGVNNSQSQSGGKKLNHLVTTPAAKQRFWTIVYACSSSPPSLPPPTSPHPPIYNPQPPIPSFPLLIFFSWAYPWNQSQTACSSVQAPMPVTPAGSAGPVSLYTAPPSTASSKENNIMTKFHINWNLQTQHCTRFGLWVNEMAPKHIMHFGLWVNEMAPKHIMHFGLWVNEVAPKRIMHFHSCRIQCLPDFK